MKLNKGKSMKKIVISVLSILTIFALFGCNKLDVSDNGDKGAEAVVISFFEAVKQFDLEKATENINGGDTSRFEISSEYQTKFPTFIKYLKESVSELTYEIVESNVDGNEATIKVNVKYVDSSGIAGNFITEALKKYLTAAINGVDVDSQEFYDELNDLFQQLVDTTEPKFQETTLDIKCVFSDNRWYIDFDSLSILEDIITSGFSDLAEKFNNQNSAN